MDSTDLMSAIAHALAKAGVQQASCFGSLAQGVQDRYSDVDLIMAADDERFAMFLSSVQSVHGAALFRPFTLTREGKLPASCGRYWFAGLSPFAKVDVSFLSHERYHQTLADGDGYVRGPFLAVEPDLDGSLEQLGGTRPEVLALPDACDVYKWSRLAKTVLRGGKLDAGGLQQLRELDAVIRTFVDARAEFAVFSQGVQVATHAALSLALEPEGSV